MTKLLKFVEDNNINLDPYKPGAKAKAEKYQVPSHTCGGSIISTKFIKHLRKQYFSDINLTLRV